MTRRTSAPWPFSSSSCWPPSGRPATLCSSTRSFLLGLARAVAAPPRTPADVVVPAGVTATVWADGLASPTALAFGPDGRLYVTELGGQVVALADLDGDGAADPAASQVFASGLTVPLGLAFYESDLYVGRARRRHSAARHRRRRRRRAAHRARRRAARRPPPDRRPGLWPRRPALHRPGLHLRPRRDRPGGPRSHHPGRRSATAAACASSPRHRNAVGDLVQDAL